MNAKSYDYVIVGAGSAGCTLARRLTERHTESGEALALRLQAARSEIAQAPWFDRTVVNDDLDRAAHQVAAIIDGVRGDTPAGP